MRIVKQEVHHNAPEQIIQYVQAALEVVAELEPPDDLRAVVFTAAVNLASAKQVILQPDTGGVHVPGMGIGGV